jgi:DNA-binding CsgD family transcriptional regulator
MIHYKVTERYREMRAVLNLVSQGMTVEQIAERLMISNSKVKYMLALCYARLGAVNAAHAVRRGMECGWFEGLPVVVLFPNDGVTDDE